MALKDLLSTLELRAPWQAVGRKILKRSGFDAHRGYTLTIDAALAQPADPVAEAKLARGLTEHALAGEKLVRVVPIRRAERRVVMDWIAGKRKVSNDLTDPFPAVAPNSVAIANHASDPSSLGSAQLENGGAAFFTSVRSFMDRVEIPLANLKATANDGYEHVYAVKRVYRQTLDAVWLPAGMDYVVLAADLPQGVPSGFASNSQAYLAAQLRKALGRSAETVNLWPAIDGLYKSAEGRLVDHGFVNNEEAVKNHTARRGGRSLRDDPYDNAGAEAVGDALTSYKVAVAWQLGDNDMNRSQPEVLLPGTARQLNVNKLEHFIARNCIGSRDLAFVTSRVMSHLPG